ncbi:MAG: hypothetical protein HY650_03610 [Acidobacteria bacterium]|nr:hypothetical protein [Acidobacteriota bacterium]
MNPELEKLITLQEVDINVKVLEEEINDLPRRQSELEARFNEFAAEYNNALDRLNTARGEQQQLEITLRESEELLDKYKQDLMRVRNEKEYSTVLREIDLTKRSIGGLETATIERIETIEKLEAETRQLSPQVEVKRKEFDLLLEECRAANERLHEQVVKLCVRRDQLRSTLPGELIVRYRRLADSRDGLALSEVLNGSCTACFMAVRPQVHSNVRRGDEIIACENCGRIMFYRGQAQMAEGQTAN